MIEFLKTLNHERGTTILVTSHDMDDLAEMARRIVMIARGGAVYDGDLAGLYRAGGDLRTATLTARGPAPDIAGAACVASESGRHTYTFDSASLPVSALLSAIAALPHVEDVELSRAPLEQIIAGLYKEWAHTDTPACGA